MKGNVDAKNCPRLPVSVEGPYGSERVEALLDTGFTGWMSLPQSVVFRLGLKRYGRVAMLTASGNVRLEQAYEAKVHWVNGTLPAVVLISNVEGSSIGTTLMDGSVVEIDFGAGRSVEVR